jgi:hypothetical protein
MMRHSTNIIQTLRTGERSQSRPKPIETGSILSKRVKGKAATPPTGKRPSEDPMHWCEKVYQVSQYLSLVVSHF